MQLPSGLFCPILGTEAGSLVFPLQLLRPVYQEDAIPEGELSTVPGEAAEVQLRSGPTSCSEFRGLSDGVGVIKHMDIDLLSSWYPFPLTE